MQAVPLLLEHQSLSPRLVIDLAISLPALFAGSGSALLHSGTPTRSGFEERFLCYC
jgi:hypothetical protein